MKILLVGGLGYIGSRLASHLYEEEDHETFIFDANVYRNAKAFKQAYPKAEIKFGSVKDGAFHDYVCCLNPDCVVYLAGPHVVPPNRRVTRKLESYYYDVMVHVPAAIAECVKRFVYVSSMRALRPWPESLYGRCKFDGETEVLRVDTDARIVRFGTVFGGLSEVPGFPNRTETVPNARFVHGRLPDKNWESYVTHIDDAVGALYNLIFSDGQERTILNIHAGKLFTRDDLKSWRPLDKAQAARVLKCAPDPVCNLKPMRKV